MQLVWIDGTPYAARTAEGQVRLRRLILPTLRVRVAAIEPKSGRGAARPFGKGALRSLQKADGTTQTFGRSPAGGKWERAIKREVSRAVGELHGRVTLGAVFGDAYVGIRLGFYFDRPKKQYTRGVLRGDAPAYPVSVGKATYFADLDKLERLVFDALSKVVYPDDRLVVHNAGSWRRWATAAHPAGVEIAVFAMPLDCEVIV